MGPDLSLVGEDDDYPPDATDLLSSPSMLRGLSITQSLRSSSLAASTDSPIAASVARRRSGGTRTGQMPGREGLGRRLTDLIAGDDPPAKSSVHAHLDHS